MLEIPEQEDILSFTSVGIFDDDTQRIVTNSTTNLNPTNITIRTNPPKHPKKPKPPKPRNKKPNQNPNQPKAGHNRQTRTIRRNGKFLQYISNKYSIFMMIGIIVVLLFYRVLDVVTRGRQKYDIQLVINQKDQYEGIGVRDLGLVDFPQVGTDLDVFGIGVSKEFLQFKDEYRQKYTYTLHRPNIKAQPNSTPTPLAPSATSILTQTHLCTKIILQAPQLYQKNLKKSQITHQLAYDICHSLTQEQRLDIENKYSNIMYNISKIEQQKGICVLSYGLAVYNEDEYRQYVESILRQQYRNYRVVVIDDCTTERASSMNAIVRFFGHYQNFVVVRNRMKMGKLGSYYLHAKLCSTQSIVVYLDAKDAFVGTKTFGIINSIFGKQDFWMFYPRYFVSKTDIEEGHQPEIPVKGVNYREEMKQLFFPGMIAYRTQLIEKIPLQHFIQYHKNRKNPFWSPSFINSNQIKQMIYSLLELCGESHAKFIDYYMFIERAEKDRVPEGCQRQNHALTQLKLRIKYPLHDLATLTSQPSFRKNKSPNSLLLKELQSNFNNYKTCIKSSSHTKI